VTRSGALETVLVATLQDYGGGSKKVNYRK